MFRKVMFFGLGLLVVGGYFNIAFGYQAEQVGDIACNSWLVTVSLAGFTQNQPNPNEDEVRFSFNFPTHILGEIERRGQGLEAFDLSQLDIKRLNRTLYLRFDLTNLRDRDWFVLGQHSSSSFVFNVALIDSSGTERPIEVNFQSEDYREIALSLVRGAVSDGLTKIADFISQNCEASDENISFMLGSIHRASLQFIPLEAFENTANKEERQGQVLEDLEYHVVDISDFISEAFFDQLTPEYLSQF